MSSSTQPNLPITNNTKHEDEEEEEEVVLSADEDLNNSDCPSTSSADDPKKFSNTLAAGGTPPTTAAPTVSSTAQPQPSLQLATGYDDSRRLFQRLWTDEDEIKLLQGFLDYTTQRGSSHNSSSYHHDTALFYEQIKSRFQLGFNKNQLVEKLRRLKKKYRNVVSRISSGKEFSFKSPHNQASFEISRKIWSAGVEEAGAEDEDQKPLVFADINEVNSHVVLDVSHSDHKKLPPRSRKRSRDGAAPDCAPKDHRSDSSSIPNAVVEDTMKSCLLPLFKELLCCSSNGFCSSGGLGSLGLNFVGNFSSGEVVEEKWRKQRILELEVHSKRVELVQEQVKLALEELRSVAD